MASATSANPTQAEDEDPSYIDYEAFLSPDFSPYTFANTLITSTNDLSDPTLDLSTPLSRVLFDLQEIDTHIHTLTSTSASPLLKFTKSVSDTSGAVLASVTSHVDTLQSAYDRLHAAITVRAHAANDVLVATQNLNRTTTVLRDVVRGLVLARQLEVQLPLLSAEPKALVRAAHTLKELRQTCRLLPTDVGIVQELNSLVLRPAENLVSTTAKDLVVTVFHVDTGLPSAAVVSAASAAASALYHLGPDVCVSALQQGLNAAVSAALNALARSLTQLTSLDRAVGEAAARCRAVVAVEKVLEGEVAKVAYEALDTVALWGSFWRAVAKGLEGRTRDLMSRGGSSARILRGARDRVRSGLKSCVEVGLEEVEGPDKGGAVAAVVGSVAVLGR